MKNNINTDEIFNLIFLNINKIIKNHSSLYFEFPKKNEFSDKVFKKKCSIKSKELKEHIIYFGTTGIGKSFPLIEKASLCLINAVIEDPYIISKHVINKIIFLLDKKEDRLFLTIINTISLNYYREDILNYKQSFISSLFNLNKDNFSFKKLKAISEEINNLNYYKFSFIILRKNKGDILAKINEDNFEDLLKLSNIIDY